MGHIKIEIKEFVKRLYFLNEVYNLTKVQNKSSKGFYLEIVKKLFINRIKC
jgi:hypothetical protein